MSVCFLTITFWALNVMSGNQSGIFRDSIKDKTGLEVGEWILSPEIWNVRNQCGTLSPWLLCVLDDMTRVLIHYKTNFIFGGGGFLKMWRSLIEKSSDFDCCGFHLKIEFTLNPDSLGFRPLSCHRDPAGAEDDSAVTIRVGGFGSRLFPKASAWAGTLVLHLNSMLTRRGISQRQRPLV